MPSSPHICGEKQIKWLDNGFRGFFHNPKSLFGAYVKPGMVAMDIGCGPGYFTKGLAEMVGPDGRVIAVDIQQGMLDRTKTKLARFGLDSRVTFHQCQESTLGLKEKAGFILAFWMLHETPSPKNTIQELANALIHDGILYLAEPKIHVSKAAFKEEQNICHASGLKLITTKNLFSRICVYQKSISPATAPH